MIKIYNKSRENVSTNERYLPTHEVDKFENLKKSFVAYLGYDINFPVAVIRN